jgi:hypothetical protein
MHRQHPYAGYGSTPTHRPGSPQGPGPDRTRMSDRNPANRGGRGGPRRGGGPPTYGYEPPYPTHAMDNPYAEDADNYRNGYEYDQFESSLGTLIILNLPHVLSTRKKKNTKWEYDASKFQSAKMNTSLKSFSLSNRQMDHCGFE